MNPNPSLDPIRIGVIGGGNVLGAYQPMLSRLRERGWAEVTRACARESQRESVRTLLPTAQFGTEALELIQAPEVDLVVILTSMREHGRLALAALQAGKHVLVEKPLANTLEEARLLVETASRGPARLACAPFTPLSPTFQSLGARLQAGDIGRPCLARARYGWSGPWWNEWFYQPGGGCLLDLGIYCFTSLTGLLGPARRVTAFTGIAIPEREIRGRTIAVEAEDNAQVLLEFGNGTLAVVTTGFTLQQYRCPALELYGTTGTLQMLGDDWDPDGYELWQNSAGCWQVYRETTPDWPWTDGLRELVESLREGRPSRSDPAHALHVLEIILRAQESGRDGRAIALETAFNPRPFEAASGAAVHLQHDRTRAHE